MRKLNLKDDSGQTMILTLVCMTVLLGFVGLATDIGLMFRAKRNMQIAADSAAIAGAAELYYGDMVAAGQAAAGQNGQNNGANGTTVAINVGPTSGPFAGNPNYIEAIVTQTEPTFFANVFNIASMNVSARAVATMVPAQGIYTQSTAGTGLVFNGPTVNMPNGVLVVNSASQPAALAANSGSVTAQSIGAVGGYTNNGAAVTPTPITGIAPMSDPLAYLTPPAYTPASCLNDPQPGTTTTLAPGCYQAITINGTAAVTFSPGTYIVEGALNITGASTITGTGVTFYFPTATSSFSDTNAGETLNLTAPTQGTYSGLLFFEDPSDATSLSINPAGLSTLEGIVYAPSASVTVNGSPTTTLYESIDAASVTINGTGTMNAYVNNSTVLTAAGLVE